MATRLLFLDDSGKPAANDGTMAVVIGGFSIASEDVPVLSRRIVGAKARFYPSRGSPTDWEVKSTDTISRNAWRRRKNRDFIDELTRILGQLSCTSYTAALRKANMLHPMTLKTTVPLQLQALVEHFAVECRTLHATGIVVSDWSNHQLDEHASRCVASYAASYRLDIHPGVYYASSHTAQAIQAADLIAGIRRRVLEGDQRLAAVGRRLSSLSAMADGSAYRTHAWRTYTNQIVLF